MFSSLCTLYASITGCAYSALRRISQLVLGYAVLHTAAALLTPYSSAHPRQPQRNSFASETSAIDVCSAVDQMTVARWLPEQIKRPLSGWPPQG